MGDQAQIKKLISAEEIKNYLIEKFELPPDSNIKRFISSCVPSIFADYIYEQALDKGGDDILWMIREASRYVSKEYLMITFSAKTGVESQLIKLFARHANHFVHISKTEPMYVAYTPDEAYGKQDRRVKTTPGKYLKKHFPELTDLDIRVLTDAFRHRFGIEDVKYATTYADIKRVYEQGPSSCMSYPHDSSSESMYRYGSHVHPSAVYEVPWVKVAYLERNGKINARAIVYDNPDNPEDKRLIRVYGDEVLRMKLEALGYVQGSFQGVKLKRIIARRTDGLMMRNTFVMPYLDDNTGSNAVYVDDVGDYLEITTPNKTKRLFAGRNQTGLVGKYSSYKRCDKTAYTVDPEDIISEESATQICGCCGAESSRCSYSQFHRILICDSCVTKHVLAIYNENSDRTLVNPEDAMVMADGTVIIEDFSLIRTLGYVGVDRIVGENSNPWVRYDDTTFTTDGSRILVSEAVVAVDGHIYFKHDVTTSVRVMAIPKNTALIDVPNLKVNTHKKWLECSDLDALSVKDFMLDVALKWNPSERRAVIDKALGAESIELRDRFESEMYDYLRTTAVLTDLVSLKRQSALFESEVV